MLTQALRRIENKLMGAVRDPRAAAVADQDPVAFSPDALRGHHYLLLITRRRDGRQVATPMWFAVDGQRLVVRSGADDPKLDRIRRDARVKVAACEMRGRPLGPPMTAEARVLDDEEERRAEEVLTEALGWPRVLYSFLRAPLLEMAYIEIAQRQPATHRAAADRTGSPSGAGEN